MGAWGRQQFYCLTGVPRHPKVLCVFGYLFNLLVRLAEAAEPRERELTPTRRNNKVTCAVFAMGFFNRLIMWSEGDLIDLDFFFFGV